MGEGKKKERKAAERVTSAADGAAEPVCNPKKAVELARRWRRRRRWRLLAGRTAASAAHDGGGKTPLIIPAGAVNAAVISVFSGWLALAASIPLKGCSHVKLWCFVCDVELISSEV